MMELRASRVPESSENGSVRLENSYDLFIDDSPAKNVILKPMGQATDEPWFALHLNEQATFNQLGSSAFVDLPDEIGEVIFESPFDWAAFVDRAICPGSPDPEEDALGLTLWCFPDRWTEPYSPRTYYEALSAELANKKSSITLTMFEPTRGLSEGFAIDIDGFSANLPLFDELCRCADVFRELHELVEFSIFSSLNLINKSVVVRFDLPDSIRTACQQYLLYFVDFLNDLGIKATSRLEHEAQQVLFSVTPEDSRHGLNNIRTALEVYLRLAGSPVEDLSTSDVAVQRLAVNIHRLKSDLILCEALLQAKDATIEAQRATITQLARPNSRELADYMRDIYPKHDKKSASDDEEVLGGILAVTRYEGKGFAVNLGEIFRRLKQLFHENDSESDTK